MTVSFLHNYPNISYSTVSDLINPSELLANNDNTLAVIGHGGSCAFHSDARYISTGLQPLINKNNYHEVWSSNTKVYFGEEDRIRWSFNESTLVASLYLEDFDNDDLSSKTQLAYEILLKFIKKSEFPHIVRIWNYIREINLGIGDQERYKQFCHGRAQAFDRFRYSPDQYPAACAIGQHAEQSVIYLIASKMPPKHYENPVQVSAYHYPRQYGPRSPSFARATTLNNHQLFLSGTAAVVGHQTVRHDDLEGQLEVTIDNINKMIAYIKNDNQSSGYTPAILRVYIRYSGHYSQIKATLDEYFCNVKDVSFMYVQGDICRENLLVEVDGEYFKK